MAGASSCWWREHLARQVHDLPRNERPRHRSPCRESIVTDLYDPLSIPKEPADAHHTLNQAVDHLYQFLGRVQRCEVVFQMVRFFECGWKPGSLRGCEAIECGDYGWLPRWRSFPYIGVDIYGDHEFAYER